MAHRIRLSRSAHLIIIPLLSGLLLACSTESTTTTPLQPLATQEVAQTEPNPQEIAVVTAKKRPEVVHWDESQPQDIVKIFSYVCIHCYDAEPAWAALQASHPQWRYVSVPIAAGGVLDTLAKIHFAAVKTNQIEMVAPLLYKAYHKERETALKTGQLQEWLDYLEKNGVNSKAIFEEFNSPAVLAQIEKSQRYTQRLKIQGTPAFIAFGTYQTVFDTNWEKTMAQIPDALKATETARETKIIEETETETTEPSEPSAES